MACKIYMICVATHYLSDLILYHNFHLSNPALATPVFLLFLKDNRHVPTSGDVQ